MPYGPDQYWRDLHSRGEFACEGVGVTPVTVAVGSRMCDSSRRSLS